MNIVCNVNEPIHNEHPLSRSNKFFTSRPISNSRFGALGNSRAPELELKVGLEKWPFLPLMRKYLFMNIFWQR